MLIGGADTEMSDPRLNMRVLQRVAASSGGRVVDPGQIDAMVTDLRAAVPVANVVVRQDLWHTGWSFAVILLLLAAEWVLRRRWGLR